MSVQLVFVGTPDDLRSHLLAPTLSAGLTFNACEEGRRPPHPPEADLVVVGPGCREPVREAQRWFQADRALMVLLLVPDDLRASVAANVATAPYVGKGLVVAAPHDAEAFQAVLGRARAEAANRRAVARANDILARVEELV